MYSPIQTLPEENISDYGHPDCRVTEERVALNGEVELRLIRFEPSVKSGHPSVLFVPGWVSRMESWQHVLREMSRDFEVFYIETREKITSKVPQKAGFDVQTIGDDLVRLIQMLGLKAQNYLMFGSSLGATVILDCYARLTEKPGGLVLVAPNAEFRMPFVWKIIIRGFYPPLYFLLKPWIKWYLRIFRLNVKKDRAQYEKYCRALDGADPYKLKSAALAFSKYKVWSSLRWVDCPVLVIGGSHDKLHEPENLKRMAEELPRAEYMDMETNARTHTAEIVGILRRFASGEKRP